MAADAKDAFSKLTPGSAADPSPFGKFLLMGLIARGGMAEVYRAKLRAFGTGDSTESEDILAIKCMRPALAKETRFVEMFIREGKLAVLLDHESIVRTLEIGRVEGRYFIAMEYIGGKDLTQVLRRCQESNQRIPVPHACFVAACMAEGLHYAHTRADNEGRILNIVNRDVSPSNVRINYEGQVKLLDFGIAQAMLKFTSEIGVLKGKFSYMSPEQIRGMPVDARTDVFSTGIILHEMLTTEKLFRGDTEFALMEKVRKAEVPPPSKFNRRVPEALDRIVMKALARDLDDRYQSARQLADELSAFGAQYKLKATEMQEFMRNLFRADYQAEAEELAACRRASLEAEPQMIIEAGETETLVIHEGHDAGHEAGHETGREAGRGAAPTPGFADDESTSRIDANTGSPLPAQAPKSDNPGSLWSRLRKKFTK